MRFLSVDEPEPAPLVPARSDNVFLFSNSALHSACHSSQNSRPDAPTSPRNTPGIFGPTEESLSKSIARAQKDTSPPPPSERGSPRSVCPSKATAELCKALSERDVAPPPSAQNGSQELHIAVWLADCQRVAGLLRSGAKVNSIDHRGATPLMLAVELMPRAREYLEVVQLLLEFGADPRARSAVGWSPIDEAVSRGDENLVRKLFEYTQIGLKLRWEERLACVKNSLLALPDFECRIRWEFESPVLPLLNKLAPSDVLHLRKCGTSLRLDSTLASWKKFRLAKRREFSTLFRGDSSAWCPSSASTSGPRLCQLNHSKKTVTDITESLDSEEANAVVDDLVQGEVVQWDMQVDNFEFAEGTNWLGNIAAPTEVNGWRASKFDVRGSVGISVRKKGSRSNYTTFEDYFGCPLPADACLPEFRREFDMCLSPAKLSRQNSRTTSWSECTETVGFQQIHENLMSDYLSNDIENMSTNSEVLTRWPDPPNCSRDSDSSFLRFGSSKSQSRHVGDNGGRRSIADSTLSETSSNSQTPSSTGSNGGSSAQRSSFFRRTSAKKAAGDKVGKTSRRVSASVWLANDFAIPLEHFLPVLETLATENEAMRRLKELLNSQGLKDASERTRAAAVETTGRSGNIFPVKVSVPMNLAIRAIVHFEEFTLKDPGSFNPSLFEVPQDYSLLCRRDAQKTLNRSRKRMLLAHLAI